MGRRAKLKEIEYKKRILVATDELQRRSLALAANPIIQFLRFAELSYEVGRNVKSLFRKGRRC